MKNMIVLIDTNVALDFLAMRQLYYEDTRDVIRICAGDKAKGYIAFHSVTNISIFCERVILKTIDALC